MTSTKVLDYFTSLVADDDAIPLTETALAIAQDAYPDLDLQAELAALDVLALRLKRRIAEGTPAIQRLRLLNHFFYRDLGLSSLPLTGPLSVAVPGAAAAVATLHARASRSLGDLWAPAIAAATDGVPCSPKMAADVGEQRASLAHDPGASSVFLPGGAPPRVGDLVRQPELGTTLARLAEDLDAFYTGWFAHRAVAVEPAAQLPLLPARERGHAPRVVRVPLDQRQRLEHGVVDARRHVGSLLAADPRGALGVALDGKPPDPGPADQEQRARDCPGGEQRG